MATSTEFPPELAEAYACLGVLGRGGMGVVFEARDRDLDRRVAVKCMQRPGDPAMIRRFEREAEVLASLTHPAIPAVLQYGRTAGGVYIVMELLEGSSLEDVASTERACRALLDVAEALEEVHARGLVHRDIKPANLFSTEDGRGLLLDFGLVGDERVTRITKTGEVLGTFAFLPPEVLRGGEQTPAGDWYGWGACLYHAIERKPPYRHEDLTAWAVRGEPLAPPRIRRLDPAHPLRGELLRYLAPDPGSRPTGIAGVRGMLEDWLAGVEPPRSPRPPALEGPEEPRRPEAVPRRGPGIGLVLAWVLAAGAGALGWRLTRVRPVEPPTPPPSRVAAARPADRTASIDARIEELLGPHQRGCTGLECDPVPTENAHLDAVLPELLDPRLASRVEGLLEDFEGWFWGFPDDAASPPGRARVRAIFQLLLPHVGSDLARLSQGALARDRAFDPEALAAMGESRRVRNLLEDVLRRRVAAWKTRPVIPSWFFDEVSTLYNLFPHDVRTDLSDIAAAAFARAPDDTARGHLARTILRLVGGTRREGCGLPSAVLRRYVEVLDVATASEANTSLGAFARYLRDVSELCPEVAAEAFLEVLPGFLSGFPADGWIDGWGVGTITTLRAAMAEGERDPGVLSRLADLNWWARRAQYLQGESRKAHVRDWQPGDARDLARMLTAAEAVGRAVDAGLLDLASAVRSLQRPLLAALRAGQLAEDLPLLRRVAVLVPGLLERIEARRGEDLLRFETHVRDSLAMQWRLLRPLRAPRLDRVVLALAFRETEWFPAAWRVDKDVEALAEEDLSPEARAVLATASRENRERWAARLARNGGRLPELPGSLVDPCELARGEVRWFEEHDHRVGLDGIFVARQKAGVVRAFAALRCVLACGSSGTCGDDPVRLGRWIDRLEDGTDGPYREQIDVYCRTVFPGGGGELPGADPLGADLLRRAAGVCEGFGERSSPDR